MDAHLAAFAREHLVPEGPRRQDWASGRPLELLELRKHLRAMCRSWTRKAPRALIQLVFQAWAPIGCQEHEGVRGRLRARSGSNGLNGIRYRQQLRRLVEEFRYQVNVVQVTARRYLPARQRLTRFADWDNLLAISQELARALANPACCLPRASQCLCLLRRWHGLMKAMGSNVTLLTSRLTRWP
eukprot:9146658-Pyramimonas_sp.AAC.1